HCYSSNALPGGRTTTGIGPAPGDAEVAILESSKPRFTIHIRHGERADAVELVDEIPAIDPSQETLIWLDLEDPNPSDLAELGRRFGFHHLAVEDAVKQHQRPKVDSYQGYEYITFFALSYTGPERGLVKRELGMFAGPNYLITIHRGPMPELVLTREQWHNQEGLQGPKGIGFLLYNLLDTLADGYFPAVEALGGAIDELEDDLFERGGRDVLQRSITIRRQLLDARRIVSPERDILNLLVRTEQPFYEPGLLIYFNDVYDHLIRVNDAVDLQRDLLSGLMEAYLSVVSNNLNQVMKVLTAYATILMALALITGVFGMNFQQMPGLDAPWGFAVAMLGMAVVGGLIAALFRKRGWL
ncbi:MAG: magnesium/cobalt transporter CorA, partial [Dehalococcoidia bacterium]|nr:magnesium/cobalt transporter CorA [Dehalococcoidia bacterium]